MKIWIFECRNTGQFKNSEDWKIEIFKKSEYMETEDTPKIQ